MNEDTIESLRARVTELEAGNESLRSVLRVLVATARAVPAELLLQPGVIGG